MFTLMAHATIITITITITQRNLSHKDKMFNGGALGNYSLAGFEMVSTVINIINTTFFFVVIVIIIFSTKGLTITVNCSEKVQKTCIGLGEANIF